MQTWPDRLNPRDMAFTAMFITSHQYGMAMVNADAGTWAGRHMLVDEEFGKIRCPGLGHDIDYAAETVRIRIPRNCIGRPNWVRVGMTNFAFTGSNTTDQQLSDNPHNHRAEVGFRAFTTRLYRP